MQGLENYRVEYSCGQPSCLVDRSTSESFQFTHRPFSEVNLFFGGFLKTTLEYLRLNLPSPFSVLDIAGDSDSTSAAEIARLYGPQVEVINLDPYAKPSQIINLTTIPGWAQDISFHIPPKSIDLVYSCFFFSNFNLENGYERQNKILEQVATVLNEGGIALIFETEGGVRRLRESLVAPLLRILRFPRPQSCVTDDCFILSHHPLPKQLQEGIRIATYKRLLRRMPQLQHLQKITEEQVVREQLFG